VDLHIEFTHASIRIPVEQLPSREIGASVEFRGIVREMEDGASLTGLWYEAYESMARRRIEEHVSALAAQHPCAVVHLIHRLGWVSVGEASLFIRVLSRRRREALALIGELVDRLKDDVPIWKCLRAPAGDQP
jgi:molybdopterin synthase catalytic subunit